MIYFIVINGILCSSIILYAISLRVKLYHLGILDAFTRVTLKKLKKELVRYEHTDTEKKEILKYIKFHKLFLVLVYLEIVVAIIVLASVIKV
jgi:hypothetical protein